MPNEEYDKRLGELKKFSSSMGASLTIDSTGSEEWLETIAPYRELGERSERCWKCYEFRLDRTLQRAAEENYDIVTTSLTISPHKDPVRINKAGRMLSAKYNVSFLESDFKKNDGFKNTMEISKKMNFYRQQYCGCIYSKMEREKQNVS